MPGTSATLSRRAVRRVSQRGNFASGSRRRRWPTQPHGGSDREIRPRPWEPYRGPIKRALPSTRRSGPAPPNHPEEPAAACLLIDQPLGMPCVQQPEQLAPPRDESRRGAGSRAPLGDGTPGEAARVMAPMSCRSILEVTRPLEVHPVSRMQCPDAAASVIRSVVRRVQGRRCVSLHPGQDREHASSTRRRRRPR